MLGRSLSLFLSQTEKVITREKGGKKKGERRERRQSDYRRNVRTACLYFYFETKSEDTCQTGGDEVRVQDLSKVTETEALGWTRHHTLDMMVLVTC